MGANDRKRFLSRRDQPDFVAAMARWINAGQIPPFGTLFPESVCEYLSDDEKAGAEIIQISFLLTNRRGEMLLTRRAAFGAGALSGHTVTTGDSVLVSWSPVDGDPRRFPSDDGAMLRLLREEVDDTTAGVEGSPLTPELRFLGLVRSDVRGPRYYFYVYEARYDAEAPRLGRIRTPGSQPRLRKDRADDLLGFVPVDDDLARRLAGLAADRAALALWRGDANVAFTEPGVRVVPWQRNTPPPHREKIPDVFLSHATPDDAVANALADEMERQGLQPWIDHRTLRVGERWYGEIQQAVRYARCFLVICSAASAASQGVADEVALAAAARHQWGEAYPIFPVVIGGARREEFLPAAFRGHESGLHVADLRDAGRRPEESRRLVERIRGVFD